MKLVGGQFKRLVDAICETYEWETLSILLRRLDPPRSLKGLASDKVGLFGSAAAVIRDAEEDRWLFQLVTALHNDKLQHPELKVLFEELTPAIVPLGDPYDTYVISGQRAFVARRALRSFAKKLNKVLENRILKVVGEECTGKSFSKEFIYYLSEASSEDALWRKMPNDERPKFLPVWIDMSVDAHARIQYPKMTALEVGNRILSGMRGLEMSQKLEREFADERVPRWGDRFSAWLSGELANSKTVYWLIFDGFKDVADDRVYELIDSLVEGSLNTLSKVRLVLLGHDRAWPHIPAFRYFLDELDLDAMRVPAVHEEVLNFAVELHRRSGDDNDEIRLKAPETAQEILKKVDFTKPRFLEELGRQMTKRAASVLVGGGANGGPERRPTHAPRCSCNPIETRYDI